MKNACLLFLIMFIATTFFGQTVVETRTAYLMDGDYSLQGTVYLELYDDSTLNLRFDNDYLTQSNLFDVHVFLTNDNNYNAPIDTSGMLLVENIGTISGLNYSSGPRVFNLGTGVNINDYQYIVFICVQYGLLHWGDGEFSPPIKTGLHPIEELDDPKVNIYPNPLPKGEIEIKVENVNEDGILEVFNAHGGIVLKTPIIKHQTHYIQLIKSGVYFFKMNSDTSSTVKRIIKL